MCIIYRDPNNQTQWLLKPLVRASNVHGLDQLNPELDKVLSEFVPKELLAERNTTTLNYLDLTKGDEFDISVVRVNILHLIS
jgi:hypothetical protein